MKILYIFPHPDDESFGPGHVMALQRRQGHEVHLLTLTRGGATKQRFRHKLSVEEMGELRYREMLEVRQVLGLSGMKVLDLPDGGLAEMDPRAIEEVVRQEILRLRPQIIVSYNVFGVSGFPDHLVTHAVVKRVCCELREREGLPQRFAMYSISEDEASPERAYGLRGSKPEAIDCVVEVDEQDIERVKRALDCYRSFQAVIEKTEIKKWIGRRVIFEFFQERFEPPLGDLCERLEPGNAINTFR